MVTDPGTEESVRNMTEVMFLTPEQRKLAEYETFLRSKLELAKTYGFAVKSKEEVHPLLKDHQRAIVQWAVQLGRAAIFAAFGLGKSVIQLEIARLITQREGGRFLIVAPLGVRQEFMRDAAMLGIPLKFIRRIEECDGDHAVYITNYETVRDGKLDPTQFIGASLDEAAVLRGFGGTKTFREFMKLFAGDDRSGNYTEGVRYRFVATATPSPNEFIELLAYAAYLGIMQVGEAKTRFFKRDATKADKLTLHKHKEREFWLWCASWAIFLQRPSDLGYDDTGYDLPDLQVEWHEVKSDHSTATWERSGQGRLLKQVAIGVQDAAKEKRESLSARCQVLSEIIDREYPTHDEQFIVWCTLDDEQRAVEATLKEKGISYSSLYGSQDIDSRDLNIAKWKKRETVAFVSKPQMYGSGINMQQCHTMIFIGIGFKFAEFIQSLHRIYRFLQAHPCTIHLIYTEAEREVRRILERKWQQHKELVSNMTQIIKEYGLAQESLDKALQRSIGCERIEVSGEHWKAVNNDCVVETTAMKSESVHLILTSIPFSTQYEYTPCYDEQTEVLTRRGWLSFGELTTNDMLATVNQSSLILEWQAPSQIIWQPYDGPMIHFNGRAAIDLMVTPDHKMFFATRVGNLKWKGKQKKEQQFDLIRAADAVSNFTHRKWRMVTAVNPGDGPQPEFIEIPATKQRIMPQSRNIKKIAAEDFMQLAGWYLSEGCCRNPEKAERRGEITISQSRIINPQFRQEIADLFSRIGLPVNDNNEKAVVTWSIPLANFLREQFGTGSYVKRIPRWIKDLHPDLLCVLRNTMMKGDGNSNGMAYTSFSKQLRDDFQEICLLTGWRASVSGNVVRIGQCYTHPEIRQKPQAHEYSGMIGCATVPNHTLVVRRNGKIAVSGNSYNDFGHNVGNPEFWQQMDFLTPQCFRVLQPGRICAIHVKDRIIPGGLNGLGFQTAYPCHVDAIHHYTKHGFAYMGMKTIVTDVVRENNQTYRLGWTEQCKDGTKMGVGMPEYLLLFRKPPTTNENSYADTPVVKSKGQYSRSRWQIDAHAFTRSDGNRLLTPEDLEGLDHAQIFQLFKEWSLHNVYNFENHVKIGESLELQGRLPVTFMLLQPQSWSDEVWSDVTRMRTLNTTQALAGREAHLCPLPIDLVERAITQFSNKGEIILDPFLGLGTVAWCAVRLGRVGWGIELNSRYFLDSVQYLKAAEAEVSMPTLFDLVAKEQQSAIPQDDVPHCPDDVLSYDHDVKAPEDSLARRLTNPYPYGEQADPSGGHHE